MLGILSMIWNRRLRVFTEKILNFTVLIEQDEDGIYVASVPELEGCHTQARTLDELRERMKEAIQLYLEVKSDLINDVPLEFIGIQKVEVTV